VERIRIESPDNLYETRIYDSNGNEIKNIVSIDFHLDTNGRECKVVFEDSILFTGLIDAKFKHNPELLTETLIAYLKEMSCEQIDDLVNAIAADNSMQEIGYRLTDRLACHNFNPPF
jgi:hypothetical protein